MIMDAGKGANARRWWARDAALIYPQFLFRDRQATPRIIEEAVEEAVHVIIG
ncbi:MAG: hypothetical protein J0H72_22420 [Burkholderiales bacterium]|nr:hypothetical protein [Burkholderiales bacterium]